MMDQNLLKQFDENIGCTNKIYKYYWKLMRSVTNYRTRRTSGGASGAWRRRRGRRGWICICGKRRCELWELHEWRIGCWVHPSPPPNTIHTAISPRICPSPSLCTLPCTLLSARSTRTSPLLSPFYSILQFNTHAQFIYI